MFGLHTVVQNIVMHLAVAVNGVCFLDCCRNIGLFVCAVERAKRFVNVHLHCIVSNLKRSGKMSTLPRCDPRMRTPHTRPRYFAVCRLHGIS